MRVVTTDTTIHTEGVTLHKERGPSIRREVKNYEHVRVPVMVPKPQIEDFNSLVVVQDKIEYYV